MTENNPSILDELAGNNPMFLSVTEHLKSLSKSDSIFTEYEQEMFDRLERNTIIKDATITGLEQGREQGQEYTAIENATKMLEDNVDITKICKWTGLSTETVEKLKAEMK